MAESRAKKPRIRKTAPTKRELVEAAQAKPVKKSRLKRASSAAATPIKKLKKTDNTLTRILSKVLRPIGRFIRFITPKYFVEAWREVRQVTWPNRYETWRLSLAVFIFAFIFGALVSGVDKVLDEIFKKVILK